MSVTSLRSPAMRYNLGKRRNVNDKQKNGCGNAIGVALGGLLMWYGLVELTNHENVREAAAATVFGFIFVVGSIVYQLVGKHDSDSN